MEDIEVDSSLPTKKGDKDPSPSSKTGKENISGKSNVEKEKTPTFELVASAPGTSTDESTGTTGKFNTLTMLSKVRCPSKEMWMKESLIFSV